MLLYEFVELSVEWVREKETFFGGWGGDGGGGGGVLYFLTNCWFYLGLIGFFCQEIFLWLGKMGIILQLL